MRLFIRILGGLACLFGAALLFVPAAFYAPTGIDVSPLVATLPQAHGATLFGLGVFNLLVARSDQAGLRAALIGNLIVQVLSFAIVVRTMMLGPGMAVAPGLVIHTVLGAGCLFFLARRSS